LKWIGYEPINIKSKQRAKPCPGKIHYQKTKQRDKETTCLFVFLKKKYL